MALDSLAALRQNPDVHEVQTILKNIDSGEAVIRDQLVTVIGGSGFIGRHLVRRLAAKGYRVRVAVRDPQRAAFLQPMGFPGQVVPFRTNIRDARSLAKSVEGAWAVVNLVGVLNESGRQRFHAVHAAGAGAAAKAAHEAGAEVFAQISAIGADKASPSAYARSKASGEEAVTAAFPEATILRPSIVFGPEDDFFNRFASMARISPVLPLIGGGHTLFQPVWVGDVAEAILRVIETPDNRGGLYELGGPRTYSFADLMRMVLVETGRKRLLINVPWGVAKLIASFTQLIPNPPLTVDQVVQLKQDNVVAEDARGLDALGIEPVSVEGILPTYLGRYRRGGAGIPPVADANGSA